MNNDMHGKRIREVQFDEPKTGNPQTWVDSDATLLELSATYHGDRDEHWIVARDKATGEELCRLNARKATVIDWLPAAK